MRQVRVVLTCDEGYVAETLRDIAAMYEDGLGEREWYEAEHGGGFMEDMQ